MLPVIKKLFIPTIFIGVIIFMIVFIMGQPDNITGLTYITRVNTTYGHYYRLDIGAYLKNLETAFSGNYLWDKILPEFPNVPENNPLIAVNIVIYVIRMIICIYELVFIMPLKLIVYPINIILTLIGFNTQYGFKKLAEYVINLHITQPKYF